jgi:hypothetical protein
VYALPVPLARQAMLAAILTVGDVFLVLRFKTFPYESAFTDTGLAYFAANAVGVVTSWELNRRRQREFAALRTAVAAREDAERAMQELRTLRGIIPICAHCKNIRTDAGEWQRMEVYVREHSEAEFSHGICPDCMRKLYPDIADE